MYKSLRKGECTGRGQNLSGNCIESVIFAAFGRALLNREGKCWIVTLI